MAVRVLLVHPLLVFTRSFTEAFFTQLSSSPTPAPKDHDVAEDKIFLLSLLMAEMGVHSVAYAFPKVRIITTAVDKEVNDQFHIIPGIGEMFSLFVVLKQFDLVWRGRCMFSFRFRYSSFILTPVPRSLQNGTWNYAWRLVKNPSSVTSLINKQFLLFILGSSKPGRA